MLQGSPGYEERAALGGVTEQVILTSEKVFGGQYGRDDGHGER
jgi:hypothetical protein